MPLTLLEASKTMQNPLQSGIIEIYAKESNILRVLPFQAITGNAIKYNQEGTLPGIGFRGINDSYSESTGVLNPVTESLVIAGGDCDCDVAIVKTQGPSRRATEVSMKVKALSLSWGAKFFKGDSTANQAEFDGLQKRLINSQVIAAGSTAGGDALSLMILDAAIDQTYQPTHIAMSKAMRRRFTQAVRNQSVGGIISNGADEFGRQITLYNGLPILTINTDNTGTQVLGFTEGCPGGGSAVGTSIYVLSLGLDTLSGIQNDFPETRDLGEIQEKPCYRTRVEWLSGISLWHPRCATRVWGIKDAALVA